MTHSDPMTGLEAIANLAERHIPEGGHTEEMSDLLAHARQIVSGFDYAQIERRIVSGRAARAPVLAIIPGHTGDAQALAQALTLVAQHGWDAGTAAAIKQILQHPGTKMTLLGAGTDSPPPLWQEPANPGWRQAQHKHQPGRGIHYGWLGHDGHPVHRHTSTAPGTEWQEPQS
jgi:hypothetical protein